jgi:undecaprenyl-diphosphatase
MLTIPQAIIIGLLQGASELFPVSSLGHSIIFPQLFGWNIRQNDNAFLIFLVATHFATALVLLFFYRKTWLDIIRGILRSLREREIKSTDHQAKLGWLLVVGTVPAGILGVLFQDQIRAIFVTASSAALFLILNGFMLLGAEKLRKQAKKNSARPNMYDDLAKVSWLQSIKVGAIQALALIPGFSRSGATMSGGLLIGLTHEDAVNFAFLLATPIIFGAALLKIPELFQSQNHALVTPAVIGAICSAVSAFIAVKFLTRYFQRNSLKPFGIYCITAGIISSLIFLR